MDAQERIDKILALAVSRMQDEVAGLLGADFLLTGDSRSFIDKKGFFEGATGQRVVAKVGVSGDQEGVGCLMTDIGDAIRLGGTLIMLPSSELEEFVEREEYSDDIADAFGEIANILCGALSKVFEENYSKSCRLVRQEQTVIKPAQVDIASAEPFPDQSCYQLRAAMSLAGVQMGELFVLFPAASFGLEAPAAAQAAAPQAEASQTEASQVEVPPVEAAIAQSQAAPEEAAKKSQEKPATTAIAPPPAASAAPDAGADLKEWQERQDRFNTCLADACQVLQGEFVSLLGADVQLGALENRLITKGEFFGQEYGVPQLMADMEITGDLTGMAYLFCSLRDAIHLGGTLIMLPPSELEVVVAEEDLMPDAEDAYGEIANIIAGVYTGVFEERAKGKFRLVKRGLQKVLPAQVEVVGDAPIPDVLYYQSAASIRVDGKELGKLRLLLPADLLDLRPPAIAETAVQPKITAPQAAPAPVPPFQSESIPAAPLAAERSDGAVEALVISDDEAQAERIAAVIAQAGMTAKKIGFKDNLYSWLPGRVRVIFLVMRQVDERAFGIAIKVGAVSPSPPLVAVAPGWTRSRVIKAARYGVSDILATPASEALIGNSLRQNLAGR